MGAWRTSAGPLGGTGGVPPAYPLLLARAQVAARLPVPGDGGARHTVVTAPLGFGKTTALAEHARLLRGSGHAVAWLDLTGHPLEDQSQELLPALVRAVVDALPPPVPVPRAGRGPAPGRRAAARQELTALLEHGPVEGWADALAVLSGLDAEVVLVVDGAGPTTGRTALLALSGLVHPGSDAVRVVWAGRHEPPVGLARARATQDVVEVGPDLLRMTAADVRTMLLARGRSAPPERVAQVLDASAGWPLAVHLLVQQDLSPAEVDPVRRYLEAEVLDPLGPDVVALLRRTAVPERLPARLAEACGGREDAVAVLDAVGLRTGLVVREPDGSGHRLHPVLRRVLLAGLAVEGPDEVARLHRLACARAVGAGDRLAAVEHACAAGDDGLLARTLLDDGLGVVLDGGASRLRDLLASRARPGRGAVEVVHHLLACLSLSDPGTADALLLHARSLRGGDDWSPRLEQLFGCAVLRRLRYPGTPHPPEAGEVLTGLQDPDHRARLPVDVLAHVMLDLAALDVQAGRPGEAAISLQQVKALAGLYHYPELVLHCLVQLSGVAAAGGGTAEAREHAAEAVAHARRTHREGSPALTFAHVLLAWSAHQQLDDGTAAEHLERALRLVPEAVDPAVICSAQVCDVLLRFAAGDRREALLRLRPLLAAMADDPVTRTLAPQVLPRAVRMYLAQGEWASARQWLDLTERLLPGTGEAALVLARWHRARHRDELARRVLAEAPAHLVPDSRLDALLLQAVLLEEAGEQEGSHEALLAALGLAEPDAAVRPFADAGPALVPVLVRAAGRAGELGPWLARVTDLVLHTRGPVEQADPELVGLTPREMAVLAELPSLLPLQAIAERHHVSLNTCKTQVKAIYRKLGVSDRLAAVEAARRSGLLRA